MTSIHLNVDTWVQRADLQRPPLLEIPDELWFCILHFAGPYATAKAAIISKKFHLLATNDTLWRVFCSSLHVFQNKKPVGHYRSLFIQLDPLERTVQNIRNKEYALVPPTFPSSSIGFFCSEDMVCFPGNSSDFSLYNTRGEHVFTPMVDRGSIEEIELLSLGSVHQFAASKDHFAICYSEILELWDRSSLERIASLPIIETDGSSIVFVNGTVFVHNFRHKTCFYYNMNTGGRDAILAEHKVLMIRKIDDHIAIITKGEKKLGLCDLYAPNCTHALKEFPYEHRFLDLAFNKEGDRVAMVFQKRTDKIYFLKVHEVNPLFEIDPTPLTTFYFNSDYDSMQWQHGFVWIYTSQGEFLRTEWETSEMIQVFNLEYAGFTWLNDTLLFRKGAHWMQFNFNATQSEIARDHLTVLEIENSWKPKRRRIAP